MEWRRLDNESDEELIYRVCSAKEQIGTWNEVSEILNKILEVDYSESKYRKQYQSFEKILKANENKFFTDDGYLKELQKERQELNKQLYLIDKQEKPTAERQKAKRAKVAEFRQKYPQKNIGRQVQNPKILLNYLHKNKRR